jgi:hypothetical protein
MREDIVFVRERDAKHGARKHRSDYSFNLDRFFWIHDDRPGEPALK